MNKNDIDPTTIVELFVTNSNDYPKKSTICVISLTADMLGIEYMDVVDAIMESYDEQE